MATAVCGYVVIGMLLGSSIQGRLAVYLHDAMTVGSGLIMKLYSGHVDCTYSRRELLLTGIYTSPP